MQNELQLKRRKFSIGKKILIGFGILLLLIVFSKLLSNPKEEKTTNNIETTTEKPIELGEILKTEYFDIIVNDVKIDNKLSTGNSYYDKNAGGESTYLILNTTFKNTDTESRMISTGQIIIDLNGKQYKFDKSEAIMLEGWSVMMEQINPMTSITSNIVFKIPIELKGKLYYNPGRSGSDKIFIGVLE